MGTDAATIDMSKQAANAHSPYRKAKRALRSILPQSVLNWREARYFAKYGEVELHLVEFLCRQDQDSIDVGANYGGYVHFMRRFSKQVLAFEPIPDFVQLLRLKFPRDVVVEPIALSDSVGKTLLYMPLIDGTIVTGCSTISPNASAAYLANSVMEVQRDRLDNIYRGTVGFMKIDVEGHEQAVLDGALETITRCHPRLLIEIEERLSPGGLARTGTFLKGLGYTGYCVHAGRLESIEQFSLADMQAQVRMPNLTAELKGLPRSKDFIDNFIFLPAGEPSTTLDRISARLRQL